MLGDMCDPRLAIETGLDLPLCIGDMLEGALYHGAGSGPAVAQVLKTERRRARHEHKKVGRVHLDTAAGTSLLNDKSLFIVGSMYEAETMVIDGINTQGDPLTTSTKGLCAFGSAYYHPDALASVYCFGDLVDMSHSVEYVKRKDRFMIEYEEGGDVYAFHRSKRSNTYVCDMLGATAILCALNKPRAKTVRELEKEHSPRECVRARIASQLMRNLQLSPGRLMKMLRANRIKGAEITPLDVVRCIQIYGKELGFIKGHETAHTAQPVRWEPAADQVRQDHMVEVDIMFLNDNTLFLVGLARPTDYALLKELRSKNESHLWTKLEAMISELEATGVRCRVVRCDGESAVHSEYIKMKLGARGIEVDIALGKSKVSGVERLIRTLRDHARSAVSRQPYLFDDTLERWLVQYARWCYNTQPGANAQDARSPREKLFRRTIDARRDAKHAFGDYAQVSALKTTNDIHEERTTGALALCPVGNLEGTWYYLSLNTGGIVRRNNGTAVPLDSSMLQWLNERAANKNKSGKQGRKLGELVKMGTWKTQYQMEEDDPAWMPDLEDFNLDEIIAAIPAQIATAEGAVENYDGSELETLEELQHETDLVPADNEHQPDEYIAYDHRILMDRLNKPHDDAPLQTSEEFWADYKSDEEDEQPPESRLKADGEASADAGSESSRGARDSTLPSSATGGAAALGGAIGGAPVPVGASEGADEPALSGGALNGATYSGFATAGAGVSVGHSELAQAQQDDLGYNLRSNRAQRGRWATGRTANLLSSGSKEDRKLRKEFLNHTIGFHMTVNAAIDKLGFTAIQAMVKEIAQIVDMESWSAVDVSKCSREELKMIISSSTFLKEKYSPEGIFQKLKARLVANGQQQDREIYTDGSSPTVSTTAVFFVAGLAAAERRAVMTVDFPGAFLHTKMPAGSPKVLVRLGKLETMILVRLEPSYAKYVRADGTCVVRLEKALYGCVESAKMWFNKISSELKSLGYKSNAYDICVFNRLEADGTQSTITLHVDDMKVTATTEEHLDGIVAELRGIYPALTDECVHRGRVHDYLGMTFDYRQPGKCLVKMEGYIEDCLSECHDIPGTSDTPAAGNLFESDEASTPLAKAEQERFHSIAAKFGYLGKRVRPDILVAVSFLSKRVLAPTAQDWRKLVKLVRYIRGSKDLGLTLEFDKNVNVIAYVDASFGVHSDRRSHTGCTISLGKGSAYAKSSTQKIVTKSSTEAELVALSDSGGQAIWARHFLTEQGYDMDPAKVWQDNQSTLAMIKNGKSNSDRTRHIDIRYFWLTNRASEGDVIFDYMSTLEMIADILTKPITDVDHFNRLRYLLLNN